VEARVGGAWGLRCVVCGGARVVRGAHVWRACASGVTHPHAPVHREKKKGRLGGLRWFVV
jgi:hypothetical protein